MKILIFSDSHGDLKTMCDVAEKEQPNIIIYLGDGIADAEEVGRRYPDIQMIKNLGNIDIDSQEDEEWIKYTEICGKRLMMTHGHTFYTEYKMTQNGTFEISQDGMAKARLKIIKFMDENGIDITLHGHTHEPCLTQSGRGWIMCPGRIGRYTDAINPMYGMLKIRESGALEWQFVEVE